MSFMQDHFPIDQTVRDTRQPRIVSARLVLRSGEQHDIVVRNISSTGLGARTKGPAPARGECVTVILPGDQVLNGTVRWFTRSSFGLELDTPLSPEALAEALQHKAHVAQMNGEWHVEPRHRVSSPHVNQSRIRPV
ncbi:PilZ domain-containing protein [Novosphingobium sp. Chol11]|uniref:PilZ domain-containing protein n=1 Tax=Novosphingobium sp. Chol11 TaxID=1385763 RepID=UPI0025F765C2|nr:PilZ domain-containing protein [Novosphingobium sp. Chol11]